MYQKQYYFIDEEECKNEQYCCLVRSTNHRFMWMYFPVLPPHWIDFQTVFTEKECMQSNLLRQLMSEGKGRLIEKI